MNSLLSGAALGAALTASGVFQPSVIVSQLKFENFHMIQAFLTAAAASTCIVTAAQSLGYLKLSPRSFSSVGLFAKWDGNVFGGMLLGTGMMLSGACPGTVLAQVGAGVRSGFYAFQGAVLAGIVWTGFLQPYLSQTPKRLPQSSPEDKKFLTVYGTLGASRTTALVGLELMFAAIIGAAVSFTSLGPEAKISPVVGGLCIGAAQLLSVVLRKSLVGTSTSYEEAGDWFLGVCRGNGGVPKRYNNMLFSAGMIAGAFALTRAVPVFGQVSPTTISPLNAGIGGFLMILGSRIAGGCTSGHGISGLSLFSTSSFITIAATFGAGGFVGLLRG
ncbi:hypothetical protein B0T26DRAFT_534145 [Lasiosphaeria miniovina]|uniref:Sulphur transport domain-containing protein n=1 Tax=Lasiosphaeria miniovina TaxID=1954250 RepID=A0AA39ZQR8_9PEZI|nr:uncharacterized protein B0T26DRAFT_534145 [Lasiosphaeria miniovina]KAK0701848.1 hypothetical protein B0T26DRAFT_534145 [Lasiosphaeria miniovina]